jgi:hypothetical protein
VRLFDAAGQGRTTRYGRAEDPALIPRGASSNIGSAAATPGRRGRQAPELCKPRIAQVTSDRQGGNVLA